MIYGDEDIVFYAPLSLFSWGLRRISGRGAGFLGALSVIYGGGIIRGLQMIAYYAGCSKVLSLIFDKI